MKQLAVLFFVLFVVSCSVPPAKQVGEKAEVPSLVIQGGMLIDGTGASPLENATIVVRGNKIQSVSRGSNQPVPQEARVIDARGKYILPGLIDGHTHYAGYAGPLYLHYGVTTVLDLGNPTAWILAQKWASEKGLVPGPRIYTSGGMIDNPPLTFNYGLAADTVEAAKAAVKRNVADGVDAVKVYKKLRPELLRAVIEEAHLHGIPVTGHIGFNARDAVLMGIDSIEHASGIPIATMTDQGKLKEIEEKRYTDVAYMVDHATFPDLFYYMKRELYPGLIKLLVEKGTFVTPTLVSYWIGGHRFSAQYEKEDWALLSDPSYAFVPELDRRWVFLAYGYYGQILSAPKYQQGLKNLQEFLKQFAQAGGKIVAGSDASPYVLYGISLHRELELLVDAGLTPMQALLTATKYAADRYWKWKEVGSVEPGKYADLVILDANPLDDIRNTTKIRMVIQNGRTLDTRLDGTFVDQIPRMPRSREQEKFLFDDYRLKDYPRPPRSR